VKINEKYQKEIIIFIIDNIFDMIFFLQLPNVCMKNIQVKCVLRRKTNMKTVNEKHTISIEWDAISYTPFRFIDDSTREKTWKDKIN
jgi:hypothetical protein